MGSEGRGWREVEARLSAALHDKQILGVLQSIQGLD